MKNLTSVLFLRCRVNPTQLLISVSPYSVRGFSTAGWSPKVKNSGPVIVEGPSGIILTSSV